ncbi:MAG: DegT/DnrJ/EryC1/StrS family aminotransferase [Clostridiales bacterium]|nr:DegT/DnrJ/EryC1/StrS family aminotransferase [Clostridiales bacterium]
MQFHDLEAQYQALKAEIDAGMAEVVRGGRFILGPQVALLEERLSKDVGRAYCVTCGNGTDALVLALMMWGIGPGDAVFAPDFTYFASAGCASTVGAELVPVDIDLATFNMSPDALESAIARVEAEGRFKPRVVIAVDLFGQPACYTRIEAIAKAHGMLVLEDAAQGYGGAVGSRNACSFGDAAITSFFPAKPLGCYGDGGAVFVDGARQDALLRSLRANGRGETDKYDNQRIGMNSRLDTLQAAVLLPKLDALRRYELKALNQAAQKYTQALAGYVQTPSVPAGYTSSWAQYSILLENRARRDGAQRYLKERGIPSMVYYPRGIHQQTAYAGKHFPDEWYPNTIEACARILALPMHPYLMDADISGVTEALKDY